MLSKKEMKILSIFRKSLLKDWTYKELKETSNEKSNSVLQNSLKKLEEEQVIIKKKIGNMNIYKLNIKNEKTSSYIQISSEESLSKLVKNSIDLIKNNLKLNYTIIIFGSHADNTQTKNSDLDIAIIVETKKGITEAKISLRKAENKSLINLDTHIFYEGEFLEMLKTKYENLGKEILRKNLPISNTNYFFKIIIKGIENGYRT